MFTPFLVVVRVENLISIQSIWFSYKRDLKFSFININVQKRKKRGGKKWRDGERREEKCKVRSIFSVFSSCINKFMYRKHVHVQSLN